MDIYKLKWTQLQQEILRLLCVKTGVKLSQRQIAKYLNVSPTTIAKCLEKLERNEIIKIDKTPEVNLHYVELNRDNPKAIEAKRIENLKMLFESGLKEVLQENFPGCTIILFGSFSKGEDTSNSDIDIAVTGTKGKQLNLQDFEKRFEKKIMINFYKNFKEINKELKENIFNGITLSGYIEL